MSTLAAAPLLIVPALPASAAGGGCSVILENLDGCPTTTGEFNDGGVDVSAGYDQSGGGNGEQGSSGGGNNAGGNADGSDAGDGTGTGTDAGTDPGTDPGAPNGNVRAGPPPIIRDGYTVNCIPNSPCDPNFVVHISDLVNFVPEPPTTTMEPDGWAVVGLPVNLVAEASTHTLTGMLLGYEAQVRFTPVRYQWDYGDGSQATTTSGGASWAQLNLPEFSETATSHTYRDRGTFTVAVAVEYAAEYRFANEPWESIGGTLAVSSSPLTAVSLDARTVLVGADCLGQPTGPGC